MSDTKFFYNTKTFTDIYPDTDTFISDYNSLSFPTTLSESDIMIVYYLLYARYANNPIANWDETQFRYKLFGIIWQFAPTWKKKLDIQSKLRELTDEDISKGTMAIYNSALNPQNEPSTDSLDELTYINSQNTTGYKKSKIDAYSSLWGVLTDDVTETFVRKFSVCFKKFVSPAFPAIFEEDEHE